MLYSFSKENALILLNEYLKSTNLNFYISNTNINLSEYINFDHVTYHNLLSKYKEEIDNKLKYCNNDNKYNITTNWSYILFEDGLFFDNVFVIKNVMFIRRKLLNTLLYKNNLDDVFLKELFLNRINVIFYTNFELWKPFVEEHYLCKILYVKNYVIDDEKMIYKNTKSSFLNDYLITYSNNNYTIINKVVSSVLEFSPFYDKILYKIQFDDNKIHLTKEENINLSNIAYIDPFDIIKENLIKLLFIN